jgi:hypothetical protein
MSGLLLVLLGAWGALISFIGPYFHYSYTPATAWAYTSGRLWLEILPGVGTMVGGLIVLGASLRPMAVFGAWLAALSGAWFAIGPTVSALWTAHGTVAAGVPVGSTLTRTVEQLGFFTGLGVVIVFFAAMALGRFTVIGAHEAGRAAEAAAANQAAADAAEADRMATDRAGEPAAVRAGEPAAAGPPPGGGSSSGSPSSS